MTKSENDTAKLARDIAQGALEKLASDVRLVDLRGIVSYTDFFVIATGTNTRQTKAIADSIVDHMRDLGHSKPRRRESDADGSWLLLDYVDVVVHVFTPESREFYRLESLWGQVPQETITDERAGSATDGGDSADAAVEFVPGTSLGL